MSSANKTDHQKRVLLIEDDLAMRRMFRLSLRDAGFQVAEVDSGGEALKAIKKLRPHAVILDLGLSDGLGGAVLSWLLQADRGSPETPVWVAISALDRQEVSRRYGPLGDHFLPKPFNPWDLVTMLEKLLKPQGQRDLP